MFQIGTACRTELNTLVGQPAREHGVIYMVELLSVARTAKYLATRSRERNCNG